MESSPLRNVAILDVSHPRRSGKPLSGVGGRFHTDLAEFRARSAARRRLAARDRSLPWALLRLGVSAAILPFAIVWIGVSLLLPRSASTEEKLESEESDRMV